MRYLIAVAAVLSAMALSACERKPVVTPSAPTVVVPGPAGPQGATGATGMPAEKGATGATGAEGTKGEPGGGTIIVVPADPAPKR